jgi:hypothetical protein
MLFYVAFYKLDVVALRQEVLAVYTAGAPPLNIRELSQHSRTSVIECPPARYGVRDAACPISTG